MSKKSKVSEIVWEILDKDEQAALMLSIELGKSTWQAGEIMDKAHYKYLEIVARANKFFKMYTEYFNATGNLKIPDNCIEIPTPFRDYILYTVFERKTQKQAIRQMGNSAFIVPTTKERILNETLDFLDKHENPHYQLFHDLIKEFDRWNNARILPISLQEPSAFKRRNKTRLVKHLRNLASLDPYYIQRFEEQFKIKPGRKSLFVSVLSDDYEGGYQTIRIKNTEKVVDYISKHLRLYIFNDQDTADSFGFLVNKYLTQTDKDCKTGQKFWPMYRKIIEQAFNYLDVNNIIPRRKHLEKAFRDMDEITMRKQDKKANKELVNQGEARVEGNKFWGVI